jgi:hypothetical protein
MDLEHYDLFLGRDLLGPVLDLIILPQRLSFCLVSKTWLQAIDESVTHLVVTNKIEHLVWQHAKPTSPTKEKKDVLLAFPDLSEPFVVSPLLLRFPNLRYLNLAITLLHQELEYALPRFPAKLSTLKLSVLARSTDILRSFVSVPWSLERLNINWNKALEDNFSVILDGKLGRGEGRRGERIGVGRERSSRREKNFQVLLTYVAKEDINSIVERHGATLTSLKFRKFQLRKLGVHFFRNLISKLPKISELRLTADQPSELCWKLNNISESGLPMGFEMDSDSAIRFQKIVQEDVSDELLYPLADPRVTNLKKLHFTSLSEDSSPLLLCDIITNNPSLHSLYWPRFPTLVPEFLEPLAKLKNLTVLSLPYTRPEAEDFVVIGRELRNLIKFSGKFLSDFKHSHLAAFVSEMSDPYPLRIWAVKSSSSAVSPLLFGKYLAPKCPNLEIVTMKGKWAASAFQVWSTCPCYLKSLVLPDLNLPLGDFSEFLAQRGKNLLEIRFKGDNYNSISTEELEVLNLPKNCPNLRRINKLDVEDPEEVREYLFCGLKNFRELTFHEENDDWWD